MVPGETIPFAVTFLEMSSPDQRLPTREAVETDRDRPCRASLSLPFTLSAGIRDAIHRGVHTLRWRRPAR